MMTTERMAKRALWPPHRGPPWQARALRIPEFPYDLAGVYRATSFMAPVRYIRSHTIPMAKPEAYIKMASTAAL